MRATKYLSISIFLLVFFHSVSLFGDIPNQIGTQVVAEIDKPIATNTSMAIHTYGGGELFKRVFNAISMLIYGNSKTGLGKTFHGIFRITLLMGGFAAICLAFLREKAEHLIKTFFLPALAISQLILVPRTDIYIQDHLIQNDLSTRLRALEKVSNVPYLLARISSAASTVSYKITTALEGVAHGVDDEMYNWTGHIYAADSFFKLKKHRIANREVEENFREFCRECVWRDIGLGLYTRENLVNEKNLLDFLLKKTSKLRAVKYREPCKPTSSVKFLPCNEAIAKIKKNLNGVNGIRKLVLGETLGSVSTLLNQSRVGKVELENLLKQQAAIEILQEETPGTLQSFASKRAEIQQQENQKILGALGASSIVAMHNFFEAIVYMIFPIIILVSLLSFGVKTLTSWLQFVLWINIWPPFYVVINFLLTSIWNFRKVKHFGEAVDLTIVNSEGLTQLYNSMESIAAITMAFIPFLSWALIKGGVSSMVHLASSLTSPAQSAAATAASEKVTGNYSYGNVSLNTANGFNQEMFKQSTSGRFSQGAVSIDQGMDTTTFSQSSDKLYMKQNDSYLREGISKSTAFNHAIQDQLQNSESIMEEQSAQTVHSATASANKALGVMDSFTQHQQHGKQLSYQQMNSQQKTVQDAMNLVDDYSNSYGMTKEHAAREMAELGVSFFGTGIKGSVSDGHSQVDSETYAERVSKSENFMKQLSEMSSFSQSELGSVLNSEDMRQHSDFVQSWNDTQSSADQLRTSTSQHKSLSNLESYAKSDNLSVNENLNQRFVDFLSNKFEGDTGLIRKTLESPIENGKKQAFIDEFVQDWKFSDSRGEDWSLDSSSLSSTNTMTRSEVNNAFNSQKPISFEKGSVSKAIGELSGFQGSNSEDGKLKYSEELSSIVSDRSFSRAESLVEDRPNSLLKLAVPKKALEMGSYVWDKGKSMLGSEQDVYEDEQNQGANLSSFGQGKGLFLTGEIIKKEK
ncbi:MAG: conjugal transfer protein TraG N-terminal domain-containing protein [Rhabdochlamydiaceae bacterium]|nr:conjugal transfer protein TraG N-terminal domain-containing protein [Candidatus Amphrikana amoebophyrae]